MRPGSNWALGSCHVNQFRSPIEFAPHAAWLLTDPSLDPSNCECKYCSVKNTGRSRKLQSRCNRSDTPTTVASLSSHRTSRSTPLTLTRRLAGSASSVASERRTGGIRRQPSLHKIPPQQEGSGSEAPIPPQLFDLVALSYGRLYRHQELVWLVLDEPLSVNTNSRPDEVHTLRFWPGVVKGVVSLAPGQPAEGPETLYLVTIISVERSYFVPQKSIIPFRAYSLDENTLIDLQSSDTETLPNDFDHGFDPLPQSATPETSPGLALERSPLELFIADIKIAKHIATIWTATDDYFHRSQQSRERAGNSRRYRGLWWGAERIWVGDLLILSFPESSIKYSNEDSSCFARDLRNEDSIGNLSPEDRKPEEKCVFFKLRALETVRTEQGVTELEAIGSVYRLAPPLDSEEPRPSDTGLPRPPDGFVFRAVLSAGVETQLPLRLIRGRYYPQLLSSVTKDASAERGLRVMEGLCPPGSAPWRPSKYAIESRHGMLNNARNLANKNC